MRLKSDFNFQLPVWLQDKQQDFPESLPSEGDQMALAIELSRLNIEHGGGPFGAIIVDRDTKKVIAAGVNLVTTHNLSCAHAEMVAISMAQQNLECFRLSDRGNFQLVTSCEPCAMCFGAIPWSGVSKVICGASKEDAEAVGFDEGPKPCSWTKALEKRGIEVTTELMREQAQAVLYSYSKMAGLVY